MEGKHENVFPSDGSTADGSMMAGREWGPDCLVGRIVYPGNSNRNLEKRPRKKHGEY